MQKVVVGARGGIETGIYAAGDLFNAVGRNVGWKDAVELMDQQAIGVQIVSHRIEMGNKVGGVNPGIGSPGSNCFDWFAKVGG